MSLVRQIGTFCKKLNEFNIPPQKSVYTLKNNCSTVAL